MIARKKKPCCICNAEDFIWSRGRCKPCSMKGYAPKDKVKKPIPKISDKQFDRIKQYSILNKQFRKDNPLCQVKTTGCTHIATETHHKKGRIGDRLLDGSTFLSVCHNCHDYIHANCAEALRLKYSKERF